MNNATIYYVDFNGNKGSEINNIHLGIIFKLPKINNMVFCVPLTSPKEKHFKTYNGFINRNHLDLKYQNLVYIEESDSIALLDQMRTISVKRLVNVNKNELNNDTKKLLGVKITKYMKHILK